jgi:CRISPR/Cas system-associated protein endoribonuclease Cas2
MIKTQETTKQRKMNQFRSFALKQGFLKISVSLHTAFEVETRLAAG